MLAKLLAGEGRLELGRWDPKLLMGSWLGLEIGNHLNGQKELATDHELIEMQRAVNGER